MDTNKMREQFEAWALSAKAHGEHFDLSRGNHGAYKSPITHWLYCSWVASYRASREAVVVELPNRKEGRYCDLRGFDEVRYCADVIASIEAQGLKVAP
ncbi:hypothetical protein CXG45_07805 [Pseudomonas plecoglossicida]|uniref:Phage protein n=1 Tax=Pseudomonas plecoglossicida TaxID=70775 RepID=A0ABX4U0X0_PSEDL|nr:hypothetical protein [Pseudomonas plecoglossicida]PLU86317.1 hypothetical protein CXG44_15865 [Pseudomonas plecoglossicida]PLU94070.1 hypothetical protein CXG45_07805 [Pseudomonas plecoglossicida]PLV04911.1 hypothetical protein CXG48_07665 [Pseudomonas plecoglossicida]PLV14268.1 hypothetical protein CXG47_12805 [Pseudomonas plecoglossicida]